MAQELTYELGLNIEDITEIKGERHSEPFWPFDGRDPVFDSFGIACDPCCIVSYKGSGSLGKQERTVFYLQFDGALPKDFSVGCNASIGLRNDRLDLNFKKEYVEHNKVKLFCIRFVFDELRVDDEALPFYRIHDDCLFIKFTFRMYFNDPVPRKTRTTTPNKVPPKRRCNLCPDFQKLYDSKEMADVTITVGDDSLLAHKLVLVTRSSVFKAMLNNDCLESRTKTILITDADASVFNQFLKYLYCCEISDKSFDMARNLYVLADKYDVDGLKKDCRDILETELNEGTVFQLLETAKLFAEETLKEMAVKFITQHFTAVSKKPEWIKICEEDPKMGSDVFEMITLFLNDKLK